MTRATIKTIVMAAALISAPALAQTNPPAAPPANPPAAAAPPVTPAPHIPEQKIGEWLATKMPGVDVYNSKDEKIGDIAELVIDKDGKINAIVISVGGFLGMGKHDVAVPFAEVKWVDEAPPAPRASAPANPGAPGAPSASTEAPATTGSIATKEPSGPMAHAYPYRATVNMTAEELKAAPAFKYAR